MSILQSMTDAELVKATRPPQPIADAFLRADEAALEILLDLLFACHDLVDNPEQEDHLWHQVDVAWMIKRLYDEERIPPALAVAAPTWDDAIRVSEEWLRQFPHDCSEFEWWGWRRDEWETPSIVAFFRGMLLDRISQTPGHKNTL